MQPIPCVSYDFTIWKGLAAWSPLRWPGTAMGARESRFPRVPTYNYPDGAKKSECGPTSPNPLVRDEPWAVGTHPAPNARCSVQTQCDE